MKELLGSLKALADDTRLRILNLILHRECCVCEVMRVLKISQTRASRNLTMLHEAGFLMMRKRSLWVYYSINPELSKKFLGDLVTGIEKALKNDREASRDLNNLSLSIPVDCCKENCDCKDELDSVKDPAVKLT